MFLDLTIPDATRAPLAPLFNAIVAPRPIGWISSVSASGDVNLAPFSYFNGLSSAPPMVMFACNSPDDRIEKDTLANVREVPEFVFNLVSMPLAEAMNASSAAVPRGVDEFVRAGLEAARSSIVRPPRVAEAPAAMECRVIRIVDLPPGAPGERASHLVIGRVVAIHARDEFFDARGRFDSHAARPVVRLGGMKYATITEPFELARPEV
jgi:flavin reductase (DIM6/NTAB) family NADH-FMN oxidoreductase RutF